MKRDHASGLTTAYSISRKAALIQLCIISLIMLCFSTAIILFTAHRLNLRLVEHTDNISRLAETSLATAVWQVDHASARDFINAVFQDETVVFARVVSGREIMASKIRPEFAGMEFEFFRESGGFLTKSIEIKKHGDWIGSFLLAISTKSNNTEMWIYTGTTLALALLIIGAISMATTQYSRRVFFAPLAALEESATLVADGDLDASIDTSAPNELGNLARAIDDMRDSVRHLVVDLQEANAKLQNHQNILETRVKERTEELKSKNTSLNEALEEVHKSKKAAEVANLAKSSFLASMSHEIRTPMNAILGMADILWETELTPDQEKYVDVFRTAGETLLEILDDVLDLSKIEAGYLELDETWFPLNETLSKTCSIIDAKADEKSLKLTCTVAPNIPDRLFGDPTRLRQILINLLGNAIKFTDQGTVELAIEQMPSPDGVVLLQFSVSDTGMGIPATKLATIFDAFTQVDSSTTRQFGGTGLGLAICKELANLMGGRIWAESTPGRGSTFYFTARFEADKGVEIIKPKPSIRQEDEPALPAARILMLEDSKYNAFVVQTYLKGTPCTMTVMENGVDGLEAYKNGDWDMIFMDIQMPIMDGYEATKAIRKWELDNGVQPIPIVAMTAYALNEDAQRCIEAGADQHMAKPVKKSALFSAIQQFASTDLPDKE